MNFAFVPFLLLVVPVLEIAGFILIGQAIGLGWTMLGILLTAIIGTMLLRRQGLALLGQMRSEMNAGRVPARELADAAMLLVAGILLLTPGFVTDALGFSLFLPPVRATIRHFIGSRVRVVGPGGMTFGGSNDPNARRRRRATPGGPVVDLDADEYHRETPRNNGD